MNHLEHLSNLGVLIVTVACLGFALGTCTAVLAFVDVTFNGGEWIRKQIARRQSRMPSSIERLNRR